MTWPAVSNATTTATAIYPNATSTSDLPLANGTPNTCTSYTQYFDTSGTTTDYNTCGYVAYTYSINMTDILAWNPSLTYDAGDASSCALVPGYQYCVGGGTGTSSYGGSSPDGSCGPANNGYICGTGYCCSASGYCGSTSDFCDIPLGCQSSYGTCARANITTIMATVTSSAQPSSTAVISTNGGCGTDYDNYTCVGSTFGDCCSEYGFCGSGTDYCDVASGCQAAFGTCSPTSSSSSSSSLTTTTSSAQPSSTAVISTNGGCGTDYDNYTCAGSAFGDCCSQYGFCGSTSDYCATSGGCQTAFGTCT
jgi:hypothetical protein